MNDKIIVRCILAGIGITIVILLLVWGLTSCGTSQVFKGNPDQNYWRSHVPASVVIEKPKFVFRADYSSYKNYVLAVAQKVDSLERNGHKVVGITSHYGYTMERNLVERFIVIYYHKIKEK